MSASEEIIYQEIMGKLKVASKDILERVLDYVDGVLGSGIPDNFKLTEEEKKSLMDIKKRPYSEHTDINLFLSDTEKKYAI